MRLTLTKRGDYGFRIVLHLARQEPDERLTARSSPPPVTSRRATSPPS